MAESSVIFDTHRFIKRMTAAGLAPPIAEALADEHVQLLEHNLATKEDLAKLKESLRNETAKLIAEKSVEIIKWNVGTTLLFGSIIIAAFKFL